MTEPLLDKRSGKGRRDAAKVLRWLENGGREKVRAIVQKAVKQTEERNKARRINPAILDRRFTW